ncbi:MAG: hypothetical protein ABIR17_12385 [Pseudolysinimonas sp.]|uniref:hypothetical protein n=1 Tax=Pseudolysinimonas sp. TaxID=2680009 RepID=UPI003265152C
MSSVAKRALGIVLAIVLAGGIVAIVVLGRGFGGGILPGPSGAPADLTVVRGVIGSEKKPFFQDPQVQAIFAEYGLDVQVTTAGSRQIATSVDLTGVDFVFPSSAPAAEKIKRELNISTVYAPFYSPMAIATFKPIVQLLSNAGIAHQQADGTWILDVKAYLAAIAAGTRWNQLPGAADLYNSSRSMLISSTDIRQSNSAAMYLSMASYVANGDNIVSSPEAQNAIIDEMASLFLEQGFSASSSEAPFEDYLSQGIGSKPMVMIYEAQFLGRQMNDATAGAITDDMVLMYPSPTVLSKHTVVPLTPNGDQVGQLLAQDPRLAALAAQYGFRPADPSVFADTLTQHGIPVPPSPVDVVEPPSYETLEAMITAISERYDQPSPSGSPTGTDPDQ